MAGRVLEPVVEDRDALLDVVAAFGVRVGQHDVADRKERALRARHREHALQRGDAAVEVAGDDRGDAEVEPGERVVRRLRGSRARAAAGCAPSSRGRPSSRRCSPCAERAPATRRSASAPCRRRRCSRGSRCGSAAAAWSGTAAAGCASSSTRRPTGRRRGSGCARTRR